MRPQRESEGPRDWLYYVAVGALVLALANVSTVRGYLSEPPAHEFIGTSSIYYPDLFYHLSFATQVARGEPLLEQKYNGNQVQTRLLINLPAMVIGSLMWLGLSGEAVYIAVRNLVGCCLLFMIYLLCRRVLLGRATRLIAFTVAAVGSGLSWIPNLVGYFWINPKGQPYDIWAKFSPVWGMLLETWPDAHVLELSTIWLISTEFIAPATIVLILLYWYLFSLRRTWSSNIRVLLLGLVPLLIGLVHPHDIINLAVTTVVLLVWGMFSNPRPPWVTPRIFLVGLPAVPIYLLHIYMAINEVVLADYFGLDDSVKIHWIALALGLPGILVLARLPWLATAGWRLRILLCAAVVCLVLFTGPIPGTSQWYNLHGLQILVSLLCIAGLERVRTLKHRRLAVSLTWAVLLLAPGNLIPNYIWDWARVSPEELEYFRPMALSRTLAWMRKNIPDTAVVLTDLKTVYHVPYKTGCRVAVGPPEQTRYYTQKAYEQMMWRQRADDPKRSFLTRHEISHILLTPVFTTGLHPDKISGLVARGVLRRIHKDNEFSVYETDLDLARSGPKATNASPR